MHGKKIHMLTLENIEFVWNKIFSKEDRRIFLVNMFGIHDCFDLSDEEIDEWVDGVIESDWDDIDDSIKCELENDDGGIDDEFLRNISEDMKIKIIWQRYLSNEQLIQQAQTLVNEAENLFEKVKEDLVKEAEKIVEKMKRIKLST